MMLALFAVLPVCLASPSEYWALASPAVRKARALQGLEAGKALGGRRLSSENNSEAGSWAPVWCGQEKYNGAAGQMWYANPFTTACSRASMDLVYVDGGRARVAKKGDFIKMTCDNWECPIPPVVDCYFDRNACQADEWCMVITHEKWGAWAMGKKGHTPNFELCGEQYYAEIEAIASQGDVRNVTVEALKLSRDRICGSSTVGMANGIQLEGYGYSETQLWKPSHGRCVKYRQEGQSCIPTLATHGRFANAFVRRAQTGASYPNGGTMERPLACAPGLVCTGPDFDVLPSTCVKSLQTAFLVFPGEVASAMHCKYWTGPMATFTAEVRKVTHNIFKALWPSHLVGECPTLEELYASMWRQTGVDLTALSPEECEAGEGKDGRIAEALALVGSWTHRPNLLWSLIHFSMHNQPSPMSRNAVAASTALASHLSENFWCNDCRGFFTVGVLSVVGLPPQNPDGEEHARYWNLGHNIASEHVATTRGGHPWINTLEEAQDADVGNPFFVPYETSVKMWPSYGGRWVVGIWAAAAVLANGLDDAEVEACVLNLPHCIRVLTDADEASQEKLTAQLVQNWLQRVSAYDADMEQPSSLRSEALRTLLDLAAATDEHPHLALGLGQALHSFFWWGHEPQEVGLASPSVQVMRESLTLHERALAIAGCDLIDLELEEFLLRKCPWRWRFTFLIGSELGLELARGSQDFKAASETFDHALLEEDPDGAAARFQSGLTPRKEDWTRIKLIHSGGESDLCRLPFLQPSCALLAQRPEIGSACGTHPRLTLHLGLRAPSGATLTVAGQVSWSDGKVIIFDATATATEFPFAPSTRQRLRCGAGGPGYKDPPVPGYRMALSHPVEASGPDPGRFVLGRGAEKKAAYCDAKANVPRCSSVPWSILLENVEGKPTKTVPVASKLKDPTFKALSPETPSWICEVSSALGSVQTVQCIVRLESLELLGLLGTECNLGVKGDIGGRHCLMLLEHDAAIDFFIAPLDHKEMSASDVGSGGALCALSGLPLDAPGSREGGWLYREVFSKSPTIVLEEALQAASLEAECGKAVSADQVNLGLRQLALKAQADGMHYHNVSRQHSAPAKLRTQVWLELVRRHLADTAKGGQGSALLLHAKPKARDGFGSPRSRQIFIVRQFLRDLEKPDDELEAQASRMSLPNLRRQNQTLADECASYFVLGLDGPTATTDEIKKAYRDLDACFLFCALALKEHPDKAGIDNKERFQEIQEAYAAVLKRSKSDIQPKGSGGAEVGSSSTPLHKFTKDAVFYAEQAKDAAEEISLLACRSFDLCALAAEARGLQKRAALRELMAITRQGALRLRDCSTNMRILRVSSCYVAECAAQALEEYGQWAASIMSGVGLQERGEVVKTTGLSCGMTADHLDDMAVNDENMVGMLENPECSIDQVSAIRVLSESTARTATVIRCGADKAICIANSVLELGCSLAMLDQECRREKAQKSDVVETAVGEPASSASSASAPTSTFPKEPGEGPEGAGLSQVFSPKAQAGPGRENAVNSDDEEEDQDQEQEEGDEENKDGKPKQAKLLVRNLRWLESLGGLGGLTRTSIQHDRAWTAIEFWDHAVPARAMGLRLEKLKPISGGMLKGVEPEHKGGVFDLVGQILHAALAEASIWSKDSDITSKQVLERSLAFALALEHTKQAGKQHNEAEQIVAVPAEVKTQVMKHAALLDVDLLCNAIGGTPAQDKNSQIIEGPFQKRLLSIGGRRGVSSLPPGRPRALGPGAQCKGTVHGLNANPRVRHVLTNKRTHRNMHTATEACHLYLAAAHPVRAYSMMQSRLRGAKPTVQFLDEDGVGPSRGPEPSSGSFATAVLGQKYSDDDESCSAEGITPGVCALASLARSAPTLLAKQADCDKQESRDRLERALIAEIESALAGSHAGINTTQLQRLEKELKPIYATLQQAEGSREGLGYSAARYLLHQHFLRQHAWYVRGLNPAGDGRKPPDDKVLRLLLVTLSRLTGPVDSLLWPWNGGYVANSCLGNDNGLRWKEIHQRMMFLLEAAHEPGSRFQAYHKRVSRLDEAKREDFMTAWEDVTNFTAEISFATEDHPVAHDCWCGVGASIVFQTLPQWPTQVLKASAGKSRTFYPPLEICMVMSLWGETCGVWPLNLLLHRVAEHFQPFVRQCSLPVELVNRAPGTIAYGLLKKLSTYEEHNAVVDLCVGQALPAALLASKSATVEYVERFTFMILWWSACRRPTRFKNSVYSLMAGRYDVMRTLAFRPETPFQVWEKAESGLLSNYSTALRRDQQNQLLDLMDVAHSVCEMLGIAYVLNGGGLLGSMRHLSIIPWDDDAEMAIVEEDDRGVEILLLALAMRLESRLELAKPDVASLVEASDWSEEETDNHAETSMLLDRLEAVDRTADFLSRGYSRRSGPLYSDSMIFPRRKRYWKRPDSADGLVLWTFNKPSEYLELLYGANWFTECLREEGHADEANRRLAPWNGEDPYMRIPCAEVAAVVQYTNVSEDQWTAIYGAVTTELGNGWHCQNHASNPPEAILNTVLEKFT
ncbi:licD [Symbiodinium microadriaticum]|nr:licD [Symbiodinium microadriaticum]